MLANTFVLNDKLDEADAQYKAVLAADAKDGDAMYGLGFLARKRGMRDEAREWFKKACEAGNAKGCKEGRDRYKTID